MFAAGLFLVYAALLLAHRTMPSLTDYANWTYQGVLLRDHLLGHADPLHVLKSYPVPNSAATLGIGLLALALPWKLAAKAWLLVQLAICFVALRQVFCAVSARWSAWMILPPALFLNVNFWYGFMNFELGLAWVLLLAALLLRRARGEKARDWPVGALLLIAFFTHMIPFAMGGLMVLLFVWQTRRVRMLWQVLPSAAVAAWYVLGRFLLAGNADGQAGMQATMRNYSAAFWAFKVNSYLKSFGLVNPLARNPLLLGRVGFGLLFGVNLLLAGLMAWLMLRAAQKALRERKAERFLWVAVLMVSPVFLLAPGEALGVSDPGARLLQVALALALALACREPGRVLLVAGLCGAVLSIVGLGLFAREGFAPAAKMGTRAGVPKALADFAHVPNDDQDYFYGAIDVGDETLKIFPTGMFLNKAGVRDGAVGERR